MRVSDNASLLANIHRVDPIPNGGIQTSSRMGIALRERKLMPRAGCGVVSRVLIVTQSTDAILYTATPRDRCCIGSLRARRSVLYRFAKPRDRRCIYAAESLGKVGEYPECLPVLCSQFRQSLIELALQVKKALLIAPPPFCDLVVRNLPLKLVVKLEIQTQGFFRFLQRFGRIALHAVLDL